MLIGYRQGFSPTPISTLAFDLANGNPATVLGLPEHGVKVGAVADLVALRHKSIPEAVATHPPRRLVMKRGRVVGRDGRPTVAEGQSFIGRNAQRLSAYPPSRHTDVRCALRSSEPRTTRGADGGRSSTALHVWRACSRPGFAGHLTMKSWYIGWTVALSAVRRALPGTISGGSARQCSAMAPAVVSQNAVAAGGDVGERAAEVPQPVRVADDIGVERDAHDERRARPTGRASRRRCRRSCRRIRRRRPCGRTIAGMSLSSCG